MRQIINATQIEKWFAMAGRDGEELLPHLIRRLIRESIPSDKLLAIRIPVGDQIGQPGFDGVVRTKNTHPFVPRTTVWEAGVGNSATKFRKDYKKRTGRPGKIKPKNYAFVFVTPNVWPNKTKKASEREKDGTWKSIIVWDASDLEAWLETNPATASWLAKQMGVPVEGMRDVETYFKEELDARYGIDILPELIIGGREDEKTKLKTWLEKNHSELRIEGESLEEAAAFIAATILTSDTSEKEQLLSKTLFIDRPETVDFLTTLDSSHIIVALNPETKNRAKAINSEKLKVLVPTARQNITPQKQSNTLDLKNIHRQPVEETIELMGLTHQDSRRIAKESKGSLTAILWMIAREHDIPFPWTTGEAAAQLVPLVLAGQWLDCTDPEPPCSYLP